MRTPFLSGFWPDREQERWLRWAVAVWMGFLVAAVLKVLVQPTIHTVYPVFAEAARNWWRDISLYLFSPDRDLFRYSPTFAVLMTPFGLLPDWLGGIVWLVVNTVLLLVVLHWSAGEVFAGLDRPGREAIWLILTWVGSARSLWAGQSNSLVLAGAIGAMLAIHRQRWWTAALLLTAGGFIKVWPWALALLAGVCWPRQLLLRMLAMLGFWAAIPFLTRPPGTVLWQYQQWGDMLNATQIYRWGGYRDAWTIWEYFQFPVPRDIYEQVQCQTALAVLAWCLWQRRHLGSTSPGLKRGYPHGIGSSGEACSQISSQPILSHTGKEVPLPSPLSMEEGGSPFPDFRRSSPEAEQRSFPSRFGRPLTEAEAVAREPARMAVSLLGIWAGWQLLFGPGAERLTYILIAPMVSWAVLESFRSRRYRVLALVAWGLISLFSMGAFERLAGKIIPWAPVLLPAGVGVFVVWLLLHETAPGPIWPRRKVGPPLTEGETVSSQRATSS